jgi:hypothetical protein
VNGDNYLLEARNIELERQRTAAVLENQRLGPGLSKLAASTNPAISGQYRGSQLKAAEAAVCIHYYNNLESLDLPRKSGRLAKALSTHRLQMTIKLGLVYTVGSSIAMPAQNNFLSYHQLELPTQNNSLYQHFSML